MQQQEMFLRIKEPGAIDLLDVFPNETAEAFVQ